MCARPTDATLFRIGKLDVFQQDRIVLLGRNGVGKSQFVRLLRVALTGDDVPGVRASPSIVLGYVDQLMSHLPDTATPHGFISGTFRPGDQRTISLLARRRLQRGHATPPYRRSVTGSEGAARPARAAADRAELLPDGRADQPRRHRRSGTAGSRNPAHEATCIIVSHDRAFARRSRRAIC